MSTCSASFFCVELSMKLTQLRFQYNRKCCDTLPGVAEQRFNQNFDIIPTY